MKFNTRKIISAGVALALCAVILFNGTFAWQSINQEALNETHTQINPGGRLHDDFNGTNKDVYVENFTDPNNGGIPIFARIRLDEYMEIGPDAGINRTGGASRDVVILGKDKAGNPSDITNVNTWTTHIPELVPDICINGSPDTFHDYWSWDMGGKTVYMPTFNTNKDSLEADINGSYANVNLIDANGDGTADPYEDYKSYNVGDTQLGFEIWDIDSNNIDELKAGGISVYDVVTKDPIAVGTVETDPTYTDSVELNKGTDGNGVTHTAKETKTAAVVTMQQWIALGCPMGNYWVYDVDGWAYWAAPILPGETTGLLLDAIHMDQETSEDCYYAINVVAQFASRGDWGDPDAGTGFYDQSKGEPPTKEALFLLNQAAGVKPTVTLTGVDGADLPASVTVGGTLQFEAELTLSERLYKDQRVVWTVSGSLPLAEGTAIDPDTGLLTVSADEDPENVLMVKAVSVADPRAYTVIHIPVD